MAGGFAGSKPRKRPRGSGDLSVAVLRAELSEADTGFFSSDADAYVVVCVHQGVARQGASSPLDDRDGCDCKTSKVEDDSYPTWSHLCTRVDVHRNHLANTTVTFEAYDEDLTEDDFMGAADVNLLDDVVRSGLNGLELPVDLIGPYPGTLFVNVTWNLVR